MNRAAEQQRNKAAVKAFKNYCSTDLLHYCSEVGSKKVKGQIPFLTGQILNQTENRVAAQ